MEYCKKDITLFITVSIKPFKKTKALADILKNKSYPKTTKARRKHTPKKSKKAPKNDLAERKLVRLSIH